MSTALTYHCANTECRMEFQRPKSVDLNPVPPQIDDVMLCGFCGRPSIVTLEGTRLMTEEDFKTLSKDELRDLRFAQRVIAANQKAKR